jgi:superfamily II DNA/RNA helicase
LNLNQQLHDPALESYSRISDNPTKRSGNGFRDLGIAPGLIKEINRLKFEKPTPVQKEAIPIAIRGDDIIGIAQTGSGKTLAFGIPMLQHLSRSKRATGLIVVPTRELAIQVEESIQSISRSSKIRTVVLIGGASMSLQRNTLKKNPRIVIATPGRLMDHIERRTVNLTNVEVFILDEADRMLDMGFIPDIKKIMKSIPDERQTAQHRQTLVMKCFSSKTAIRAGSWLFNLISAAVRYLFSPEQNGWQAN